MNRIDVEKLLDRYFESLIAGTMETLPVTDDVTFQGPRLGPFHGSDTVLAVLAKVSEMFTVFKMTRRHHLIDGDEAVLFIDFEHPEAGSFAIADHFQFEDGRFSAIQPFFDPGVLQELGMTGASQASTQA